MNAVNGRIQMPMPVIIIDKCSISAINGSTRLIIVEERIYAYKEGGNFQFYTITRP